jgi:hypothetical protein
MGTTSDTTTAPGPDTDATAALLRMGTFFRRGERVSADQRLVERTGGRE